MVVPPALATPPQSGKLTVKRVCRLLAGISWGVRQSDCTTSYITRRWSRLYSGTSCLNRSEPGAWVNPKVICWGTATSQSLLVETSRKFCTPVVAATLRPLRPTRPPSYPGWVTLMESGGARDDLAKAAGDPASYRDKEAIPSQKARRCQVTWAPRLALRSRIWRESVGRSRGRTCFPGGSAPAARVQTCF